MLDLNFNYAFIDNITAGLNIANLMDSDPPLNPWVRHNGDTQLYDIYGRYYCLAFTMNFGN